MRQTSQISENVTQAYTALTNIFQQRPKASRQVDILMPNTPNTLTQPNSDGERTGSIVLQRAVSNGSRVSQRSQDSDATLVPPVMSRPFDNDAFEAEQNNASTDTVSITNREKRIIYICASRDGMIAGSAIIIVSIFAIGFAKWPSQSYIIAAGIGVTVGAVVGSASLVVRTRNLMAQKQKAAAQINLTEV